VGNCWAKVARESSSKKGKKRCFIMYWSDVQ
jgi:hypothetical protein